MEDNQIPNDYDKPVAYDAEGKPLYAHPLATDEKEEEEQSKDQVDIKTKLKHDISKKYYPSMSLRRDEYVTRSIRRHPIGVIIPLSLGTISITVIFTIILNYNLFVEALNISGPLADPSATIMPLLFMAVLAGVAAYISYFVYTNNRFCITNESVIQDIQVGLFSRREKIINLDNIEDASYHQKGIIQHILNYGSIRLSTKNASTIYHFTFVANPQEYLKAINTAIDTMKDNLANN